MGTTLVEMAAVLSRGDSAVAAQPGDTVSFRGFLVDEVPVTAQVIWSMGNRLDVSGGLQTDLKVPVDGYSLIAGVAMRL